MTDNDRDWMMRIAVALSQLDHRLWSIERELGINARTAGNVEKYTAAPQNLDLPTWDEVEDAHTRFTLV
jgi:hypothetical protein